MLAGLLRPQTADAIMTGLMPFWTELNCTAKLLLATLSATLCWICTARFTLPPILSGLNLNYDTIVSQSVKKWNNGCQITDTASHVDTKYLQDFLHPCRTKLKVSYCLLKGLHTELEEVNNRIQRLKWNAAFKSFESVKSKKIPELLPRCPPHSLQQTIPYKVSPDWSFVGFVCSSRPIILPSWYGGEALKLHQEAACGRDTSSSNKTNIAR